MRRSLQTLKRNKEISFLDGREQKQSWGSPVGVEMVPLLLILLLVLGTFLSGRWFLVRWDPPWEM